MAHSYNSFNEKSTVLFPVPLTTGNNSFCEEHQNSSTLLAGKEKKEDHGPTFPLSSVGGASGRIFDFGKVNIRLCSQPNWMTAEFLSDGSCSGIALFTNFELPFFLKIRTTLKISLNKKTIFF
ncbi:hypothetical protein AVEN_76697-1 [Araneus ventricosus]|uniref:Uncharacterized protein n=1 Tax=Araneus ventricosus TaxID=182803 RepID=A0A4Y2BRP5_ARAVE|nr:hypothetical protein AVEN_76697-1 [Araneus ventricosus]